MIERIIELSIRHRFLVIAAGFVLAVAGVLAVFNTPVDAIPDLSENQVIVFAEWAGHSPREIEDQVTYPLSVRLQGIEGVRVVRSSSDFGFSMANVIFKEGVEFGVARERVAARLSQADLGLPAGVKAYPAAESLATGQIFWYAIEGAGYDLGRLRAIQDWYVRHQLNSVEGVAEVASVGGYQIEYQIDVDPLKLAANGVALGELTAELARANAAVGGHVIQKANAEFIVRGDNWLGADRDATGAFDPNRVLVDLEQTVIPTRSGGLVRVADVASVGLGPQIRRGAFEKDGNEVTGGVVLMRHGENPLVVTRRIKEKIQELAVGLPSGVRIVPVYDRTPLIEGAIGTVTGTLVEAIVTATVCVVLVLVHLRTSFVIAITLPLAVLASFVMMWALRAIGLTTIETNIMSLAGLAISIGVLVDSSIVMAENVMHQLHNRFGDRPVRGDVRSIVLSACRGVGRPIFFSVLIMLLSFLPVFALGGMQGKMFRPLAFTKSFALIAVAVLSITLVPALCTIFIRGRLRSERASWLVRSVIEVYRPVLSYLLARPAALVFLMAVTFIVGFAPLGDIWLTRITLVIAVAAAILATATWLPRTVLVAAILAVALIANKSIEPLGHDIMTPLDEGMVMDMPITVPRASIAQSADDLKARDMVLCRFPEVSMVVGKAGRAETPTDPAPLDMIETMVDFRPRELWPKRKLLASTAAAHAERSLDELVDRNLIEPPPDAAARAALLEGALQAALPRYDGLMREFAYQRNQQLTRGLGRELARFAIERLGETWSDADMASPPLTSGELIPAIDSVPPDRSALLGQGPSLEDVTWIARHAADDLLRRGRVPESKRDRLFEVSPGSMARLAAAATRLSGGSQPTFFSRLHDDVLAESQARWRDHVARLDDELVPRGAATWTRVILEELLKRSKIADPELAALIREIDRLRTERPAAASGAVHHGGAAVALPATFAPHPALDAVQTELTERLAGRLVLWRKDRRDLIGFGGDLDRSVQMPGWTNVWTMPIQNRVDMLSTGVNTQIGIRVLGRRLDDVVAASEAIAESVRELPGAVDVIADPIRGKGYLEINVDREKASRLGVSVGDVNDLIEIALGGKVVTMTVEGRERHPVRVRYARDWRDDEETIRELLVPARVAAVPGATAPTRIAQVPLADVADVRIVEGPATIKSENGLLRNYVRLNVDGPGVVDFVERAKRHVARNVALPDGVYLHWTGQFEHQVAANRTLLFITPCVIGLILWILYLTYRDLMDALLMILAVPGAMAGGVFCQWLLGYPFTVTIWIGYIACFGMATSTGIIMLVYLREAVANAGGLERMTLPQLKEAVMTGAVQRLRPKLLTEGTTIIGLAPLLWAEGPGADVIRPMVAPVLGGLLVADEVIDLFLPVLFYGVRKWRWRRIHEGIEPQGLEAPGNNLAPCPAETSTAGLERLARRAHDRSQ